MRVDFDSAKHTYFINGDIADTSVTELLHKHKLAPDYSTVDKAVLKESTDKGKKIHEDLANCLNLADYKPTTAQGELWEGYIKAEIDCGAGEQLLGINYKGLLLGGTADVIGVLKDNTTFIADHKTTTVLDKEYVTWQVNIYDYILRQTDSINGQKLAWKGANKFLCFHYNGDKLKVVELNKIADEEIERLLDCEVNGDVYVRTELAIDSDLQAEIEQAEIMLAEITAKEKEITERCKELREKLLAEMKRQKILSWETDKVKVTYVAPVDKISVDSAKVKKLYPAVFNECQKLTKVKDYVKITIRKQDDEIL